MEKNYKITKVQLNDIYENICLEWQTYINFLLNKYDPNGTDTEWLLKDIPDFNQDIIDLFFMFSNGKQKEILNLYFSKSGKRMNFFKKWFLILKYKKYFTKKVTPNLIRVGELMLMGKGKKCCGGHILLKTESGVVSLTDNKITWGEMEYKKIRGIKLNKDTYPHYKQKIKEYGIKI